MRDEYNYPDGEYPYEDQEPRRKRSVSLHDDYYYDNYEEDSDDNDLDIYNEPGLRTRQTRSINPC